MADLTMTDDATESDATLDAPITDTISVGEVQVEDVPVEDVPVEEVQVEDDVSAVALDAVGDDVRRGLEAILFLAEAPVHVPELARALELDEPTCVALLEERRAAIEADPLRGFVLRNVAGGWRLYTRPEAAPHVEQWLLDGTAGRLTQAALETLSVVAYKQPISRQEVSDVRGVSADGAIRSLVQRGFVTELGRADTPGQPILYGTTDRFLEQLGLNSLDELPDLADHLPSQAPDEPAPGDLRAARATIAGGQDLPSTGNPRWDPESAVVREEQARKGEMAQLGDALDTAAKAAMSQLERALEAVERGGRPPEPEPDSDGPDVEVAAAVGASTDEVDATVASATDALQAAAQAVAGVRAVEHGTGAERQPIAPTEASRPSAARAKEAAAGLLGALAGLRGDTAPTTTDAPAGAEDDGAVGDTAAPTDPATDDGPR